MVRFLLAISAFIGGALIGVPAFGQSNQDILGASFHAYAAATSMNTVFINPPLPMLDNVEGARKYSVMPFKFDGSLNYNENDDVEGGGGSSGCTSNCQGSTAMRTGTFNGLGFAASYNRNLSKRWSLYVLGMGATLTGDFTRSGAALGNNGVNTTHITNAAASYYMLGTAAVYHGERAEGSRFSWTFFLGPTVTRANVTGSVLETKSPANGGAVAGDFDMQAGATMPGLLIGGQLGIELGAGFRAIPFAILGGSFGDTTIQPNVRSNSNSQILPKIQSGETFAIGSGGGNAGIHIEYKPLGLALNVTSPFLKKPLFVEKAGSGTEISEISVSFSWPPTVEAPEALAKPETPAPPPAPEPQATPAPAQ